MPHAEAGQRIGLLGGSFNPPHPAHVLITEIALRRLALDEVWWLVSPGNPLKSRTGEAAQAHRMEQARRMATDTRIKVTGFESDLPTAYTAATLSFLKRRKPHVQFVWLMGADNLATIHRWRAWRTIFELMPIAVADRPRWRLKALASPAARAFSRYRVAEEKAVTLPAAPAPAWTFLTGPLSDLSSTAIRARRSNTA